MRKIYYENNWESHQYYADNEKLKDIKAVKLNGENYPVYSFEDYRTYSDHGKPGSVRSKQYYIKSYDPSVDIETKFNLNDLIKQGKDLYIIEDDVCFLCDEELDKGVIIDGCHFYCYYEKHYPRLVKEVIDIDNKLGIGDEKYLLRQIVDIVEVCHGDIDHYRS